MAATPENDKLTINERLNEFIQKNRKGLFVGFAAIIVVLAGFIIVSTVREKIRENAFSQIDAFERRYEELMFHTGGGDSGALSSQADISALLDDLAVFERKNSGFAAARAYSISASIYGDHERWAEAEKAWSLAAKASAKSYLAPISLYNAAVVAEEQGNTASAIGLYAQALAYGDVFPAAIRAQFSIGRLHESQNNRGAALEAYRSLVSRWPNDQFWTNLAQNRIIVLGD